MCGFEGPGFQRQPKVVAIAANTNSECKKYFKKSAIFTLVGANIVWIKDIIQLLPHENRLSGRNNSGVDFLYLNYFVIITCYFVTSHV